MFLLAAAGLAAAEETPAPRAAPSEDAINAARRDLDLIKASRGPAAPGKGELPRLSVPELHAPAAGATPLPSTKTRALEKEKEKERKAKNWLVDAMDKRSDERNPRGRLRGDERRGKSDEDDPLGETRTERENVATAEGEPTRAERAERAERADAERKPEPAPNALARYSADWMKPQDYALMRPVIEGVRPGDASFSAPGTNAPGAATFAGPGAITGVDSTSGGFGGGKSFSAPTPQENPYLQAIASPMLAAPTWTPPTPAAVNPTPPPAPIAAPIAPPQTKAKLPDFVKPTDDEKHFKQLKRF